jgi:hypothetical protein
MAAAGVPGLPAGHSQFQEGHRAHTATAVPRADRRLVTPDEYRQYQTQGYLGTHTSASACLCPPPTSCLAGPLADTCCGWLAVVRQLVPPQDVAELQERMAALADGSVQPEGMPPGERELSFKWSQAAEQVHRRATPVDVLLRSQQEERQAEAGSTAATADDEEEEENVLLRLHMMHRVDPVVERFMLHPRICDVLEVLIGPDVACLQSMLFFNPPGHGGQGWHQDSAYITTYPDTLIGSWLALDTASMENGCLIVAPGSCVEPVSVAASASLCLSLRRRCLNTTHTRCLCLPQIHPELLPDGGIRGNLVHAQGAFGDLPMIQNRCLKTVFSRRFPYEKRSFAKIGSGQTQGNSQRMIQNSSHLDDEVNTLSKIAKRYGEPLPVEVEPGDCKQNNLPPPSHACRARFTLSPLVAAAWCS